MGKSLILKTLLFGLVLAASGAWAGGADLFLEKCLKCHSKTGKAAPISPADKSASVWERYFERGRHPVDLSPLITPGEMEEILLTLKTHAADSDQPLAAVIPK